MTPFHRSAYISKTPELGATSAFSRSPGELLKIVCARTYMVDLVPERPRTDAIQSFVKQQTIFVEIEVEGGLVGLGYSYTIGTGGHAVMALLHQDLLPRLIGRAELFYLVIDRLQVCIQGFFEQAALLCVVALRLGGKLQALEVGVLKGEFVDGGLLEGQGLSLLLQNTFICSNGTQQIGDRLAQFVCAELGQVLLELFGCDHHETQCATGE